MSNILILEDNPDLALMLRQILEWRGHNVVHGSSGWDGLEVLNAAQVLPDLIMCDLQMPGMDGPTFLQHVRENETWSYIPFIVMSASGAPEDEAAAYESGASGFLVKPFGISDLDTLLLNVHLA